MFLCIIISNISENDVTSDTGLSLDTSPFLCSTFITTYFNLSGNTPQNSILLHMYFSGGLIEGELIFRVFMDISS